ncbi:MAG: alkaline phosphatase family protein [Deltaproteobacteria bacterium]|nr:alkaline phosphatase family protein [Deltaproteobacteria bacterium]MBW2393630.1 alkaline phosphatase family protein [Deltaproteobacteria bacterium]
MSWARRLAHLGLGLFWLGCMTETPAPELSARLSAPGWEVPPAGIPSVLVLASVAGLTPEAHRPGGPMPTLSALAEAGVAAEHVDVVMPESVYPVHATWVSGRRPRDHGILGDRLIGERGLRRSRPWHASHARTRTLWEGLEGKVLALDWPSTQGAPLAAVLPDVQPTRRDETWLSAIADSTTPWLLALATSAPPAVAKAGPERDRFLVEAACTALASSARPRFLLMRLRGPEQPLLEHGPHAADLAFAQVDEALTRLLACLETGPGLLDSAVVVVGDRALRPVHTAVRPNRALAHAGLAKEGEWQALVRSNGGSAFVYAKNPKSALQARTVLTEEADATGAFRVVSAEEMIANAADPEAWFGLEASPGFVFLDGARGPLVAPSSQRGAAGYFAPATNSPAFVAWGRGVRGGIVAPSLHQLDVAPTLAHLLDTELPDAEGRGLIGLLRVPGSVAAPPPEEESMDARQ